MWFFELLLKISLSFMCLFFILIGMTSLLIIGSILVGGG